jgi:hypothetical protein
VVTQVLVDLLLINRAWCRRDTSTPTGKLMLNLLGFFAEFEREIMLERQREGVARAKAEGKYRGRVPTAQRKAGEDLWCAWTGRRLTDDAIYRLFKKRLARLTGHDLTLHDARRIIATSMPFMTRQMPLSRARPSAMSMSGSPKPITIVLAASRPAGRWQR